MLICTNNYTFSPSPQTIVHVCIDIMKSETMQPTGGGRYDMWYECGVGKRKGGGVIDYFGGLNHMLHFTGQLQKNKTTPAHFHAGIAKAHFDSDKRASAAGNQKYISF